MSVFSIIQNSQQQLFGLQMKGRMPETAKLPARDAKVSEERQAKTNDKVLEQAETLVRATSPHSKNTKTEADDIVEDFKDAVDLNSTLSRAVKDGADTEREMRIERMAQKIKAMKEKIRFATPEKAKRMLQELQQISKNFKTAGLELRKAAEKIGPDRPNTVVDVAADATVAALGNKDVSSKVTVDDLLGYAEDFGNALLSVPAQAEQPKAVETGTNKSSAPISQPENETAPDKAGGLDEMAGNAVSLFNALESSGFMDALERDLTQKNNAAFRKASVYAYADMQHQSDSLHRQSRIEGMRAEHEALTQIFEEIKLLAGQLETLVDKDDEEVQEAMDSLIKDLAQGHEILDADDLQQFLGAGRYAPLEGLGPSASSGTVISMSSVSVETSVSISISGIVA